MMTFTLEKVVEKFDLDAMAVREVMELFCWASGKDVITSNRFSEILIDWGIISKPLTMTGQVSLIS